VSEITERLGPGGRLLATGDQSGSNDLWMPADIAASRLT
jgi:hypothetical protein